MRIAVAITCYFHEVLQPDNLVFRMLPYLFTQRDVHSTTVEDSLKPRLELGTQTHDALRPACRTSSARDSGNARNDSTGQRAPIRVSLTSSRLKELLIGQVLRNTSACE